MPNILYVNNDGGGFADRVHVDEGTTVGEFVTRRCSAPSHSRSILLNGQIVESDQVLEDGDTLSVTPTKVDGGK